MERSPVDTAVVSFQYVFDDSVCVAKEVGLTLLCSSHLFLERHGGLVRLVLLAQSRDIPNSDRQIHGGRNDEIVPWVKLRTPSLISRVWIQRVSARLA